MSPLLEIEAAAALLPPVERQQLIVFLARSLREDGARMPVPQRYTKEEIQGWLTEDEAELRQFSAGE
jgi:hypothetical protein